MPDDRIVQYRDAARAMLRGNFDQTFPTERLDEVGQLGQALSDLARYLERRCEEVKTLAKLTERINAGLVLDEVMDKVYRSFRTLLPYDRMSLALLDASHSQLTVRWTRTEASEVRLGNGYTGSLDGGSLRAVLESGQPRILNDLHDYLRVHPKSESTQLIVEEGMQSSLTCPLITRGKPVGLLFFTSISPHTYSQVHQEIFIQLTGQVALIVEKSRLYQELKELNGAKDRFLDMAAHDLRFRLISAMDTLDLVLGGFLGDLSESHREALGLIAADQQSMLDRLHRVLDIHAIESGRLELHPRLTDLLPLLEGLKQEHSLAAGARQIQIKVAHAEPVPQVMLDPERIREVLGTLVTNSIRLSTPGGTIILSTTLALPRVEIHVTDQGLYIPYHDQSEAFTLLDSNFSRESGQASGLGHAIVLRIVEAHGGSIRMESRKGIGTTFTLALPTG